MDLKDLRQTPVRTKAQALAICGSLSDTSKMPGFSFSIPATACHAGAKLRLVAGSTCANCYALKGNYRFGNVKASQAFRLSQLYHPQWVEAIVWLIACTGTTYFRWHDAGDLQSMAHLINIVKVAEELPDVRFWLPTREHALVASHRKTFGREPENLVIRASATMVGGAAPRGLASTVHRRGEEPAGAHLCPAPKQGNQCGRCRACWDPDVRVVSYLEH